MGILLWIGVARLCFGVIMHCHFRHISHTRMNAQVTWDIVNDCIEKGVLCLTAKTKVRLLPALNIPDELLAEAIEIIKNACAKEN